MWNSLNRKQLWTRIQAILQEIVPSPYGEKIENVGFGFRWAFGLPGEEVSFHTDFLSL